jgi:hypothetical protein
MLHQQPLSARAISELLNDLQNQAGMAHVYWPN